MAVRNYRYFFAFVSMTVLLIFYMMVVMVVRVVLRVVVEGDGSVEKALEIVASGKAGVYSCRSRCDEIVIGRSTQLQCRAQEAHSFFFARYICLHRRGVVRCDGLVFSIARSHKRVSD